MIGAEPPSREASQSNQPSQSSRHRLGPWLLRTRTDQTRSVRQRAICVLVGAAIVLSVSAWLKPAATGMGTHTQLGLPPCSLIMGRPCPTCGMTTAFAHAVKCQWMAAFTCQPLGALLAASVMVAALLSIWELATGRGIRINWYRVSARWVIAVFIAMVLAAWIYKIVVTGAQMG